MSTAKQRVVATARGHDGLVVREIGEEFEMPASASGSWFLSLEHEHELEPPPTRVKPVKKDDKTPG
jgi:hypothetical protein